MFEDRVDAGRKLSECLKTFSDKHNLVVLGIPRGGIPVAWQIAHALHAPLDVFLARKLGVPGNGELAFGAVSAEGARCLDPGIVRAAGLTVDRIEQLTRNARAGLREKARLYRRSKPPLPLKGKFVLLVDDGVATGASVAVALEVLRAAGAARLVVAAPIAAPEAKIRLERTADLVIALECPRDFFAVSECYRDFRPTTDDEVLHWLAQGTTEESKCA